MLKLTPKDGVMILESGRLEIFTPQKYLEGTTNTIQGDKMLAMGLVPYKFYEKETDTKPSKVGILNKPSTLTFYPMDIDQDIKDKIWEGVYDYSNENVYTRMTFTGSHKVMDQYGVKNLDNVTGFTDLLLGGKLDNNIPYPLLSPAWVKNMTMNDINLGVPITVVNLIPYELCRSVTDLNKRFASVIGKDPKVSPVSYKFANIRQICAANSVFTALAFEDMNSMLDSSLNMTKREREQQISPVEDIIKY